MDKGPAVNGCGGNPPSVSTEINFRTKGQGAAEEGPVVHVTPKFFTLPQRPLPLAKKSNLCYDEKNAEEDCL